MKVLVTGTSGFIGQHLVPRLLERGHRVTATARDTRKAEKLPWYGSVKFVACDIDQPPGDLWRRFGQPDAAIHLAWPGLQDYASPLHLEKTLPAHSAFLEALVECGVGHLLVAGTCLEYGLKSGVLTEAMSTDPVISYARAKDALRKFLESLQRRRPFTLQWARLFYMYGPGQHPNRLLAQLDRAIETRETVFDMSGGEQLRDYLPVEDVAARLVALLERPACQGCVNICSGEPISVRSLVERHLARRGANVRLNLGRYPYPDYEPMAFWGDGSKYSRHCADG